MYTLYSMQRSGNSYKVRLALARLGIPYNLVEVDILKGESRTPEFLAKNPNGQVPLLEVAPDRHLAESNAICGTSPADRRWPGRPHHAGRGAAVDVLRTAQSLSRTSARPISGSR
jgi:glutathione S-transferase